MNIIIPYFVVMLIAGFFSRYVYAGEESEIGPYDEKLGPINVKTTNQKMVKIHNRGQQD